MDLSTYFDYFLKTQINLNKDRKRTASRSVNALREYLESVESLDGNLTGVFRSQGSWEHGTVVKPSSGKGFDVDMQLDFVEQEDWDAKDYLRNLRAALKESTVYKNKLERKDRCVRVNYSSNEAEFHVDIIPIVERTGEQYAAIVNFRENDFETTNPEKFSDWVAERNRWSGGQLVKTLRLMKWLRNQRTSSPKSVILTILVADLIASADKGSSQFRNTSVAFVTLLQRLDEYCRLQTGNPHIPDPSCPAVNFDHRWETDDEFSKFSTRIARWLEIAERAATEEQKEESIAAWQELFGDSFVSPATGRSSSLTASAPKEQDLSASDLLGLRGQSPGALHEQFAEQRFDGIDVTDEVFVEFTTTEHKLGRRERRKRRLKHGIGHSFTFTVVECSVPEPFDVYWKVRNVGPATPKGKERGQIRRGTGLSMSESSSFAGEHFVECYIVKRGICVAFDHIHVPILDPS